MKNLYLDEFFALAKTGNYGEAADSLYMSASTLSRRIILLESEIGGALFLRGARKVELSKLGELFLPYARTIAEQLDAFNEKAEELKGNRVDSLSVYFANPVIEYGVIPHMVKFREMHPNAHISYAEGYPEMRFQLLRDDKCDFSLGFDYQFFSDEEYCREPLIIDHLCLAMSKNHPLAGRERLTLKDVKDCQFILSAKTTPAYKMYERLFADAGVVPQILMHVLNSSSMMKMVADDLGIAIIHKKRFIRENLPNVRLIDLEPQITQRLSLVYKRNKELSPLQQEFIRYLKEALQEA